MSNSKVNFKEKLSLISEYWTPKIVGELNDQHIKLAKFKDDFVWHHHEKEDELFYVISGTLIMEFRDRVETVEEGEMIVVPKGVEHLPRTNGEEVSVLLIEPKSTVNTGNVTNERTKTDLENI